MFPHALDHICKLLEPVSQAGTLARSCFQCDPRFDLRKSGKHAIKRIDHFLEPCLFSLPEVRPRMQHEKRQFQLIRPIPWREITSLAVEPGGAVWFVGSITRPDGSAAPTRLYVSRLRDGQPVVEDALPAEQSASAVAEYFGSIVATVNGELRGTLDSGKSWATFDVFGREDLTLASVSLYEGEPWQALWIGVSGPSVGPAPPTKDAGASGASNARTATSASPSVHPRAPR